MARELSASTQCGQPEILALQSRDKQHQIPMRSASPARDCHSETATADRQTYEKRRQETITWPVSQRQCIPGSRAIVSSSSCSSPSGIIARSWEQRCHLSSLFRFLGPAHLAARGPVLHVGLGLDDGNDGQSARGCLFLVRRCRALPASNCESRRTLADCSADPCLMSYR